MAMVPEALSLALQHHQAGRLPEAEALYRQILEAQPDHSDALHQLGMIAYEVGRYDAAVECISRAIRVQPARADYFNNLGEAYRRTGKLDEAVAAFQRALALSPGLLQAMTNIGGVLRQQGKLDEAAAHYRQMLGLHPESADLYNNLGNVLQAQGNFEDAIAQYRQAVTLRPDCAEVYSNMGRALYTQGRPGDAQACFERAIALKPAYAEAHSDLGNVLRVQDRWEEADAHYRRAIELNPSLALAYKNRGTLLKDQGRVEEAAVHFQHALRLMPDDGVKILLATLLPVVYESKKHLMQARRTYEQQVSQLLEESLVLSDPHAEVGATNFYLSYLGHDVRDVLVKVAGLYERACPSLLYTAPHCASGGGISGGGKIRIGFISRYFKEHSVAKAARGVLANLSRSRFTVTTILVPPVADDPIARFIREASDKVVVVPQSLAGARKLIADEELDILFYQDIGMDPFTYFLAFSRLAPIQCVFFGHAETSGIRNIDYYISSENIEPGNAQDHYSERLITLKAPCAYYYRPETPAEFKPRSAFGLDDRDHVYLCPQTLFKFHPDFDEILAGILDADPRARLVLKSGTQPHWETLLLARFARTLKRHTDRITVVPRQPGSDFTNLIAVSDVMLDPPHFSGLTTSLEAFTVGTPVVTLPGEFQRERLTLSLYNDMGMEECVADSPSRYVELAVKLGTDAAYRKRIKAKILKKSRLLFENRDVVREYERFFLAAVEAAQMQVRKKAPPAPGARNGAGTAMKKRS